MPPLRVVEHLDVLEDAGPGLRPRLVVLVVTSAPSSGWRRSSPSARCPSTCATPAHAALDPVPAQEPLVMLAGVLAPPVRVRHQPLARAAAAAPPSPGHRPPAGSPCVRHRPAHHPPRVQVLHGRQVQPALARRDVGDVRHPALVGPPGSNCRSRTLSATGRGWLESVVQRNFRVGLRPDAVVAHQPGDGVDAAGACPEPPARRGCAGCRSAPSPRRGRPGSRRAGRRAAAPGS